MYAHTNCICYYARMYVLSQHNTIEVQMALFHICPILCSIQCWCSLDSLAGVDFSDSDVVVEFPQAAGDSCVNISIIDDSIALEGDERFVVAYVNLPQGVNPGPLTQTNVTIQDNDGMFINKLQ